MQLTKKVEIFPDVRQRDVLWNLSERCRLLYNFALAERKEHSVNYIKQQNELPELKRKFPEYGWVYSKVLQMTLKTLDANYKSFRELRKNGHKDARPPNFKGKNFFTTMIYNQSGFSFENDSITLSQYYDENIELTFNIPEDFRKKKIYQVSVFEREGRFFISIVYEQKTPTYRDNKKFQAIDLGITKIVTAVNMDGKFIEVKNERSDKYWEPKIESLQSRRDKCEKDSRQWNKLNRNIKKCKRKSANQMKNFQHHTSKKIVNNTKSNTIIVGDLTPKKMSKHESGDTKREKSLHRANQNSGTLGRFVQFLTYKCELAGKKLIEIDESNTTKQCYMCGALHQMKLSDRVMKCDCGNEIDRDKNSAINIMIRFLSQNAPNRLERFLSKLRSVVEAPPARMG